MGGYVGRYKNVARLLYRCLFRMIDRYIRTGAYVSVGICLGQYTCINGMM